MITAQSAVILVLLFTASICDIRTRHVPDAVSIALCAAALIDFHIENLWGLLVALIVFIMALRGGICGGDVKVITALSLSCGIYGSLFLLFIAELAMLIYYGFKDIIMKIRHKRAETALPFLPFITFGYIILTFMKGIITA